MKYAEAHEFLVQFLIHAKIFYRNLTIKLRKEKYVNNEILSYQIRFKHLLT